MHDLLEPLGGIVFRYLGIHEANVQGMGANLYGKKSRKAQRPFRNEGFGVMLGYRRSLQPCDSVTKGLGSSTYKMSQSVRVFNIPRLVCSLRQVSSALAALLWASLLDLSVISKSRDKALSGELKRCANQGIDLPALEEGSKCPS
jgi:hypothetical protein